MKDKKPTKRDISKILSRRVSGWNDKRLDYNRIKLCERLKQWEITLLEDQLKEQFPNYSFCVGNVRWVYQGCMTQVVTAITFWK